MIYKSTLIFCVTSELNFLCQMFVFVQKPIRMVIKFDRIFSVLIELNTFLGISEAVNFQVFSESLPMDPLDNLVPLALVELVLHMG